MLMKDCKPFIQRNGKEKVIKGKTSIPKGREKREWNIRKIINPYKKWVKERETKEKYNENKIHIRRK